MTPKTLGRFEVVGELGRGAMGVVYKGQDPKIGRTVALKTVQFNVAGGDADGMQMRERFLVEARATGQLQHPNILTIYDVGEEAGLTYIAMEFIEGGNLEDMIRDNKFADYDHIIDIVRQVADGLDHAHSKGIVHRDIKPANIMMAGGKIPKIADFGLARLSNSTLTATGTVLGTPSYMAPEQIRGRKIDGRADLFALGVIFYEMLTGEKPYGGDSITSVIYRVVNEEPIPPRKLNIDLPEAIDLFVHKALAKEPSQRFQTGAEFAEGLRLLQKGQYTAETAKAPASAMTTQKMTAYGEPPPAPGAKKNIALIAGAAAAVLVLIAAAAVLMSGGKKEEKTAALKEQAASAPESIPAKKTPVKESPASHKGEPQKTAKAVEPKSADKGKPAGGEHGKTEKTKAADHEPAKPEKGKSAAEASAKAEKSEVAGAMYTLNINSTPAGAQVSINGKPRGQTPFKDSFKEGDYDLNVEKAGYGKYSEKVSLKGNLTVKAQLAPETAKDEKKDEKKDKSGLTGMLSSGSGKLVVEASPGDKVTVDGTSYTTFPVEKEVLMGNHNIFIVRKGKKPFLKTVPVKAGETVTVTPTFD